MPMPVMTANSCRHRADTGAKLRSIAQPAARAAQAPDRVGSRTPNPAIMLSPAMWNTSPPNAIVTRARTVKNSSSRDTTRTGRNRSARPVYPRISANSTVAWVISAAVPGACTAPFNVTSARSLGTLSGRFEGAITGGLRSAKGMPRCVSVETKSILLRSIARRCDKWTVELKTQPSPDVWRGLSLISVQLRGLDPVTDRSAVQLQLQLQLHLHRSSLLASRS